MVTISTVNFIGQREEWLDADFELPDDELFHSLSDRDPDGDWDIEISSPKAHHLHLPSSAIDASDISDVFESANSSPPLQISIRPPPVCPDPVAVDDLDEGTSTIKAATLNLKFSNLSQFPVVEDFEDDFSLPSEVTQLSLAPLSLSHRSSKNSVEWGDKDHTISSQSSDAYSSLGFADASPSDSNSTCSASCPDTEAEEVDDDDDMDGLVLPSGMFESSRGVRQLTHILDLKKRSPTSNHLGKTANVNSEEDFEIGLVIDDDFDLSASRLHSKQPRHRVLTRSQTVPIPRVSLRPSLCTSRIKSPIRASSSSRHTLKAPTSTTFRSSCLTPCSQQLNLISTDFFPVPSPPTSSSLPQRPSSIRCQKSYSGLKPQAPTSYSRSLARKSSLSCLIETSHTMTVGSGPSSAVPSSKSRYEEPTIASRAKSHKFSTTRVQEFKVPPTRPQTPSSNPAAVRLTLPTQIRIKSRPALASVFGGSGGPNNQQPASFATPPFCPRSSSSIKLQRLTSNTTPVLPKLFRKSRRQLAYGDGTELDGIDDLPTDREKESSFRVQPKANCPRLSSVSLSTKLNVKGTIRCNSRRDGSIGSTDSPVLANVTSLRRANTRLESGAKQCSSGEKRGKKNVVSSSPHSRRKPTLIRNLGGNDAPKVIGDMKWNPYRLRWEGNDDVLRDFEAVVGTSTRPALISLLTGSSVGSPCSSLTSGSRVVGNMIFDPSKMCWISNLPPEEDEPDVFANLADDEDDCDAWEANGGTIRASLQQGSEPTPYKDFNLSYRTKTPNRALSHSRTFSDSESDRGSRASIFFDIDENFLKDSKLAEERHRKEMKGWIPLLLKQVESSEVGRPGLYEIRALATRQY